MKVNNIKICDNFLDEDYYKKLEEIYCVGGTIPWYYGNTIVYDDEESQLTNTDYNFHFTHTVYKDNEFDPYYKNFVDPILDKLDIRIMIRMKFNLQPRTPQIYENLMHVDDLRLNDYYYKTAIYYLNTNNGYTKFETGEKINSIGNRMVIFDGRIKHCGSTCTDQKTRVVCNINYI